MRGSAKLDSRYRGCEHFLVDECIDAFGRRLVRLTSHGACDDGTREVLSKRSVGGA